MGAVNHRHLVPQPLMKRRILEWWLIFPILFLWHTGETAKTPGIIGIPGVFIFTYSCLT